jgi:hypothetical protein
MGTAGYLAGLALVTWLGGVIGQSTVDRAIVAVAPPLGFLVAVKISEIVAGYERIVFFEKLLAVTALSAAALWIAGGDVAGGVDLVVLGVGTFLGFGRVGCFLVGCCHGRPSPWRWGVRYGPAHADAGFPRRWVGRPLVPLQLIDSALTLVMVAVGVATLLGPHRAGDAAAIYLTGYSAGRFVIELFRGDPPRPYWLGLSEAQWTSLAVSWAVVLLAGPSAARLAVAGALTAGAATLALAWRFMRLSRYWLTCPWHIEELHRLIGRLDAAGEPLVTSLGVRLSMHLVPGTSVRDYILSHPGRRLTEPAVRAVAWQLGLDADVRAGATPGLVHLLVKP